VLPVIWTLFAVSAVATFVVIGAYWLDVQDRPDLSTRARIGWSAGVLLFPVTIPAYAFAGGPGWPRALRIASVIPAGALALLLGFLFGVFDP
jgi:hypothetical protein